MKINSVNKKPYPLKYVLAMLKRAYHHISSDALIVIFFEDNGEIVSHLVMKAKPDTQKDLIWYIEGDAYQSVFFNNIPYETFFECGYELSFPDKNWILISDIE